MVCGASQGIGAASALELARLGCRVIVLARTADKLQTVLDGLPGEGHQRIACDLGDRPAVERAVSQTLAAVGPIHILVNNNAGPKPSRSPRSPTTCFFKRLSTTSWSPRS